jgi:hypothetical protein
MNVPHELGNRFVDEERLVERRRGIDVLISNVYRLLGSWSERMRNEMLGSLQFRRRDHVGLFLLDASRVKRVFGVIEM